MPMLMVASPGHMPGHDTTLRYAVVYDMPISIDYLLRHCPSPTVRQIFHFTQQRHGRRAPPARLYFSLLSPSSSMLSLIYLMPLITLIERRRFIDYEAALFRFRRLRAAMLLIFAVISPPPHATFRYCHYAADAGAITPRCRCFDESGYCFVIRRFSC